MEKSTPSSIAFVDVLRIPPTSMERWSITLLLPAVFNAPGVSATRSKKLRELSGSSSTVRLSMAVPNAAVFVCSSGADAVTFTVSDVAPICMAKSARVCVFTRRTTLETTPVLKPGAAVVTEYVPDWSALNW